MVYCNWFATSEYGLVTPFLCYFWNLRKSLYKILATISCKCNQIKDVIMVFEKAFIFIAFKYCNFFYLGIAMFLPLIVLLVYVHCVAYLCAVVFSGLKTWVIIKIFTHPCYSRHFDWFSWGWTKKKITYPTYTPNSKDQSVKFLLKILRIGRFEKLSFLSRPFRFFFSQFFFASSPKI